jgi:tRNA pseudouridine55 synthase
MTPPDGPGGQLPRRRGLPLDGVILIDKPSGLTSNAALQRARRALEAAKAGHAGTLDPLASGLLPICLGEATKFSALLLDADKTYLAEIQFGTTTTTGDADGEIVARHEVGLTGDAMWQGVRSLLGSLEQVPPMYSALKHKGKALYEYARAGQTVERRSRLVTVHQVDLVDWGSISIRVRLRVSKGTYVRSLAEEAGRRLGCGAHLRALRREGTGGFSIEHAVPLAAFEGMDAARRRALIRPVDSLVEALPRVDVGPADARALQQGKPLPAGAAAAAGLVRIYAAGIGFLGVGARSAAGELRPHRLLRTGAAGYFAQAPETAPATA